jgi:alanyl-tRNA synthetase
MDGFEKAMQAQRERARSAHSFSGAMEIVSTYENLGIGAVEFVGYEHLSQDTSVAALLVDKVPVGSAVVGNQVEVVLSATPFYAEGGGQVGDRGTIVGPNGWARIEDTQSPVAGMIVHSGTIEEGDITLGEGVSARVDPRKRQDAGRNHSGTHILHAALRQTLGPHVRQAGSHVAPTRLRFDYSHVSPLSGDDLLEVQGLANRKIQENLGVTTRESTFTEAVSEGALAFFGDRYGDAVRIVEMSNGERFSMEVCGGTHVAATGQIGPLFVLGDFSIGGGMRRIEAVTGQGAEMLFQERSLILESLSKKLQTPMNDLDSRIDSFMDEMERLRRQVASLERESLGREASVLLQGVQRINGVQLVASRTSASSVDAMREMGDRLKGQLSSAAIVLGAVQEGRPVVIAMMTPDLVSRGLHAGNMVKELAGVMDGGGGGRPDFAQAGGKRADKLEDAIRLARDVIERQMTP